LPQKESARQAVSQIEASLLFVRQANIARYLNLLATDLSASQRVIVQSCLNKERAALHHRATTMPSVNNPG
jgi:hypothetical protein